MDALAGLLDGPRARGAFLLRAVMDPPWSVRIQDEAPLSLVAMVAGTAWIVPDDGRARARSAAGDVAVIRGPEPYTFADRPDTAPQAVIHPGQHCTTPWGDELEEAMSLGVRTWGNSRDGGGDDARRDLRAAQRDQRADARGAAAARRAAGGGVGLTARRPARRRGRQGRARTGARARPVARPARHRRRCGRGSPGPTPRRRRGTGPTPTRSSARRCACCTTTPSTRGRSADLAAEVGLSRAALARRFTELVGEPPMSFLTGWRLALAADLLREPGATVGSVARQVGYGSPFALSTAFKRVHGISPQQHRLAALAGLTRVLLRVQLRDAAAALAAGTRPEDVRVRGSGTGTAWCAPPGDR